MFEKMTFVDQLMNGLVMMDDIDNFIDAWHESEIDVDIATFLGMTEEEYSLWLNDPDMLAVIARARRFRLPLVQAVNDNNSDLKMAARSGDGLKLRRLQIWLNGRNASNEGQA